MWDLAFISEDDFMTHIENTVREYQANRASFDLRAFNSNLIDPVKLMFDASVYGMTWEEAVDSEIFRQIDKTNNNSIGYFHQRIFKYIEGCSVPDTGWDVVFAPVGGICLCDGTPVSKVYVEMKNKHNTMNSSSQARTYRKMQDQILADDECACFLVEVIARHSQDRLWDPMVDGKKQSHKLIRHVSIDQFYQLVTGDAQAFTKVCQALPEAIDKARAAAAGHEPVTDSVMDELRALQKRQGGSFADALFSLSFSEYAGFRSLTGFMQPELQFDAPLEEAADEQDAD